jgi:hypothetical protein
LMRRAADDAGIVTATGQQEGVVAGACQRRALYTERHGAT